MRQRPHRKNRAGVSLIRSEQPDGCGRNRRWLEYCPRIRARHGVGRGAESDLAVESKRRARLPILAASYRVSVRRVSPTEMRLTGIAAYLRVLACKKVAPRHAGAWLRCRWRAFDSLRATESERQAGAREQALQPHKNCHGKSGGNSNAQGVGFAAVFRRFLTAIYIRSDGEPFDSIT